eukprot:jgi/Botrbrau1/11219/Bobra.0075s0015.1
MFLALIGKGLVIPRLTGNHRWPCQRRYATRGQGYTLITSFSQPNGPSEPELGKWLKTPFDVIALGPRITVGLLASLPQAPQRLQKLLQLVQELSQDPRPDAEKVQVLVKEILMIVEEVVGSGAAAETEIFGFLGKLIPPQILVVLPLELRERLEGKEAAAAEQPEPVVLPEPVVEVVVKERETLEQYLSRRIAGELDVLKLTVVELRRAVDNLTANEDPTYEILLFKTAQDWRTSLDRTLSQLSTETFENQTEVLEEAVELLELADGLGLDAKSTKSTKS